MIYLRGFRHFSARIELFSCLNEYRTRILFVSLAAALTLATAFCGRNEGDRSDPGTLSEDERYLIDAYVDIKLARSHYPGNPAMAESLFSVLDSTIDSVRIANTIRTVNESPERWAMILEEIEREIRERPHEPRERRPQSRPKASKQSGG